MNNVEAIQKTHARYAQQSGAISRNQVIMIISLLSWVVAFLSTMGSAYGIYYDLVLDYGTIFAVFIGILGGAFIEAVKFSMVKAYFAWSDFKIKAVAFVILSIFTGTAISLHYYGADNMQRTKSVQIIDSVQKRNMKLLEQEQKRKDKIVDIADAITKNGTIADDKLAMKTLSNINSYSTSLLSTGKISQMDMMQIKEVQRASAQRAKSLKIILPLFEILSIFGFLGAYLTQHSTSPGAKRVLKEKEIDDTIEALTTPIDNKGDDDSVADYIISKMRQNRVAKGYIKNHNHPTLPQETAKIRQNSLNFAETEPKQQKPENSECVGETVEGVSATHENDYQQETKDENNSQKSIKLEDRYIDLASFEFKEAELLKILFKNGAINQPKEGLLPKRIVVDEYIKSQKSTKREAIDLYEKVLDKLVDEQFVYFSGRYKSACRGIKTVVAIEQGE
ncbi:MAG: hypothetical protein GXO60_07190 [Epsilonproteobacteria bacterium]|nr:hypothetical protein [Campylobacterota bacterium]